MNGVVDIVYDDGALHHSVKVIGDFSGWEPVAMHHMRHLGTQYALQLPAEVGRTYQYKFTIDGEQCLLQGLATKGDHDGRKTHEAIGIERSEAMQWPPQSKRRSLLGKRLSGILGVGAPATDAAVPPASDPMVHQHMRESSNDFF